VAAIYPLLPIIAADLQLSYAAAGSIRTVLVGSTSLLQLPVGYLAEWIPETALLGAGMWWISVGFLVIAAAGGFWQLLAITTVAGIGGSTQHPLATAIVSRVYESDGRGRAISTLNFAGDLGKMILPAIGGMVAVAFGWRTAILALGAMSIAVSIAYSLSVRGVAFSRPTPKRGGEKVSGWGIEKPYSFALLSIIGIIDNGTRVGVLTFLPFLIMEKGVDAAGTSLLLTLIFACGAAGKLGCGFLSDRFGNVGVIVITEAVTALATLAVLPVDATLLIPVLVTFGFVLNGTSSVLYASVAEMVHVDRRARTYGLFYTLSLGAGALAPLPYGFLSDGLGVQGAFVAIAVVTLATIPMALLMRGGVDTISIP
jgi:MFS transporter, FSR family, fosmidomycin resistance protein